MIEVWLIPAIWSLSGLPDPKTFRHSVAFELLQGMRLLRLVRISRLLYLIPTLKLLIAGILRAVTSVAFTLFIIIFLVYVFAIVFFTQSKGNKALEKIFPTVGDSMFMLFGHGALLDSPVKI